VDARLVGRKIVFTLRSGGQLVLDYSPDVAELYWEVKIRNRRRAFGL